MQTRDIGIILLIIILAVGMFGASYPYTTSQFIDQTTDLNYVQFELGEYDGNLIIVDGNLLSIISPNDLNIDVNSGTVNHSLLTNLEWSVAGHTIDTDLAMNGNSITGADDVNALSMNTTNLYSDYLNGIDVSDFNTGDYVPYQGADRDVNLGNYDLEGGTIEGELITDGYAELYEGDFTSMGDIDGADVDLTLGTGDITTDGVIYTTGVVRTGMLGLLDLDQSHDLQFYWDEDDTGSRALNWYVNMGHRDINLLGDLTVAGNAVISGTNTGDQDLTGIDTNFEQLDLQQTILIML